jgi:LPXTG-site transpeptidase (sortase) family protein
MKSGKRSPTQSRPPEREPGRRIEPASVLLYLAGFLLVLAGLLFIGYVTLNTWLMDEDRYLLADLTAAGSRPVITRTAPPGHGPTPAPTGPAGGPADVPVHIVIPALDIKRSIVGLPQVQDTRTGAWSRDVKRLWRTGRNDLVGHWGGSAYPGQEGNMVLVGHNYGYGHEGAFLHIGSLKPGQRIDVVTALGQLHSYRVTDVERVNYGKQYSAELAKHTGLLAPSGRERLTLVTCSGAGTAPFAERIYVLAEPARASR